MSLACVIATGIVLAFSTSTAVAGVLGINPLPERMSSEGLITGTSGIAPGDKGVVLEVYSGSAVDPAELLVSRNIVFTGDLNVWRDDVFTGNWQTDVPWWGPDGPATLRARQVDGTGRVNFSAPRTVMIDDTPPEISLTPPVGGTVLTDATPTFSGVAGRLAGDKPTVKVVVRDAVDTVVQTMTGSRDAVTGQYAVTASPALVDGTYTAYAEQSDDATNNTWSEKVAFTIDTRAPAPTLAAPTAARTSDPTPTLTGVGTRAVRDVRTVDVRLYAGEAPAGPPAATLQATLDASGKYQVETAPLSDGTWTAQTSQIDSAGNIGVSAARTWTVDTTAPAVTLASAASKAPPALASFAGEAGTALGDDAEVTVAVFSGAAPSGTVVAIVEATRDDVTGAYAGSAEFPLPAGTYTAVAQQFDDLGNVTTSAPVSFVVARAPTQTATGSAAAKATPTPTGRGTGPGSTATGAASPGTGSGAPAPAPPSAVVSDAAIRAVLERVLARSTASAARTAVVKRGYAFGVAAPVAGKLTLAWSIRSKGKQVLIATVRRTFTAAGSSTVEVKLNRAGRKALKRAKKLRVTAKAAYSIAGRPEITATRTFTWSTP